MHAHSTNVWRIQGLPETQGAAAVAIAHCYSQPVIVRPLFWSPAALEKKMANWEMVADSANDAVPRVVHGCLVAVSRMIQKYLDAKSAREASHTSDLQTILGLMAWAGAVRLRVAGAHVLDRMDAMPASLKVHAPIQSFFFLSCFFSHIFLHQIPYLHL
jgi:hypothetical protein